MDHHHPHLTPHEDHRRAAGQDQLRFLDLDAQVFGDNLVDVLELAAVPAPRSVVDLGAGTGAGSRLLRQRYPDAAVTCVDNDPQMLELLHEQGFAVVRADLDEGFPSLADRSNQAHASAEPLIDLVWASSSLHHVAHPARLLSGVRRALAPGGALVVAELATLPSFLSDPSGALLEQRCHAAAAAEGWNHYPNWTPVIEAAGFAVSRSEVTTVAPVTSAAREYACEWFARFSHLTTLAADDRDAAEERRQRFAIGLDELEPRTTRTVWVATPNQNREQS